LDSENGLILYAAAGKELDGQAFVFQEGSALLSTGEKCSDCG
jgi:hypothetical protein